MNASLFKAMLKTNGKSIVSYAVGGSILYVPSHLDLSFDCEI